METYVRERGSCYNVALLHIWVANKNWRLKCHCRKFVLAWHNLPRCCIIIRSKVQSQISNTIGLLILALILAQTGSEDEIAFHVLTERFQLVGWCCDSSVMYSEIPGLKSSWVAPECAMSDCANDILSTLALSTHTNKSQTRSANREIVRQTVRSITHCVRTYFTIFPRFKIHLAKRASAHRKYFFVLVTLNN